MNYTPRPEQAYLDILSLRSDTWFGDLLVVTAMLHMLRIFFTSYLLPWDQLAY